MNPNDLVSGIGPGNYFDRILRQVKAFGQQSGKLAIRGALDGWRGNPNAQGSIVLAGNLAARSAGHNTHREGEAAVMLQVTNHSEGILNRER